MVLFIDTNIILDWLQNREPFNETSGHLVQECIKENFDGAMSAHSFADLFYILRKDFSAEERFKLLLLLCKHFKVVSENKLMIEFVINYEKYKDLEDGLQMECAKAVNADFIITRNINDFKISKVPAILPEDFIKDHCAE